MISADKKIELARWLLNPDHPSAGEASLSTLEKQLRELGLYKVYSEIELPLVEILDAMQTIGVKVDLNYLARLSKEMDGEIAGLVKNIYKLAGGVVNLNSPKQLSKLLFEKLKISDKGIRKTKTGLRSTDVETLALIRKSHKIVEPILKYREIFKLKSTYVEPLRELADKNGRIHTTFVQTGTGTGRLSSQNPNIQNIPITSEWGKTASQVYNVPAEKVTPEMRHVAKTLNFGVAYGMGPNAFAQVSGLSVEEARKFIKEYYNDFYEVKLWQEKTIQKARQTGCVENLNGRRRWLPNIANPNRRLASADERMAINMPIQGLAADIIKLAMIKVAEKIKTKKWQKQVRMLLSVHDELVFEIADGIIKDAVELIKSEMENAYKISVPLKVESGYGDNWLDS
ncbi:MAG: polymerase protein [Parcubacteria group bacterium GW2011_GWA1_48_11b]|nr:MAG: polymerase protein [Parcubacteria group bacterium GW2011_GWA1_48_11b]